MDQEKARKLVANEVGANVSCLVSGIIKASYEMSYEAFKDAFDTDSDELINLCQRYDYETPAVRYIQHDANAYDLELTAGGDWEDFLPCLIEVSLPGDEDDEPENTTKWKYEGCETLFDDEDDAREASIEANLDAIRKKVLAKINEEETWDEVCYLHRLEPNIDEVYEHWIVSDWFGRKLSEKGEIVNDLCGLTIWGRCTSGQAIYIDSVVEQIVEDLEAATLKVWEPV